MICFNISACYISLEVQSRSWVKTRTAVHCLLHSLRPTVGFLFTLNWKHWESKHLLVGCCLLAYCFPWFNCLHSGQVLPKICELKNWGILNLLVELVSYRIYHVQPVFRMQLISILHSLANSQHNFACQLLYR